MKLSRPQTSETRPAGQKGASRPTLQQGRRPYSPPRLHCWGDLRGKTLGGSAGQVDSANPNFTQP